MRRARHRFGFTPKRACTASEAERPEVRNERDLFAALTDLIPTSKLPFLDKSGANLSLPRTRGWARSGSRACGVRPASPGVNLTLVGLIAERGPVAYPPSKGA